MLNTRSRKDIATKLALTNSVGKILKKYGYAKLGINLVAKEAAIDKTVIYRKFEGFDGLLRAYVEKQDFWLMKLKECGDNKIENHRAFMKEILISQFNALYTNEELQQLLIWELGDKDGFTNSIAIKRELLAEKLFEQIKTVLEEFDINLNNIYAVFISSIYYLILHKSKSTFCEMDLTKEEDTKEFIKTIEWMIDLIFDKKETANQMEQVAIDAYKEGVSIEAIVKITKLPTDRIKELIA